MEPFINVVGQPVFAQLYKTLFFHFTEESQNKIKNMFFDMLAEYQKSTPYKELILSNTNMSIMDIAQETGYCHDDYLSAQFKKKTGMTPCQYRNSSKFTSPAI